MLGSCSQFCDHGESGGTYTLGLGGSGPDGRGCEAGLADRRHVAMVGATAPSEHPQCRKSPPEGRVAGSELFGVAIVELFGVVELFVTRSPAAGPSGRPSRHLQPASMMRWQSPNRDTPAGTARRISTKRAMAGTVWPHSVRYHKPGISPGSIGFSAAESGNGSPPTSRYAS